MKKKKYESALKDLEFELAKLQETIIREGLKVVVLFEGRDAAGKGGLIKTITRRMSPRTWKVVALPKPSTANKVNGISSAMWPIFLLPVRSLYSTAPGIIALLLSPLWGFAPRNNIKRL